MCRQPISEFPSDIPAKHLSANRQVGMPTLVLILPSGRQPHQYVNSSVQSWNFRFSQSTSIAKVTRPFAFRFPHSIDPRPWYLTEFGFMAIYCQNFSFFFSFNSWKSSSFFATNDVLFPPSLYLRFCAMWISKRNRFKLFLQHKAQKSLSIYANCQYINLKNPWNSFACNDLYQDLLDPHSHEPTNTHAYCLCGLLKCTLSLLANSFLLLYSSFGIDRLAEEKFWSQFYSFETVLVTTHVKSGEKNKHILSVSVPASILYSHPAPTQYAQVCYSVQFNSIDYSVSLSASVPQSIPSSLRHRPNIVGPSYKSENMPSSWIFFSLF